MPSKNRLKVQAVIASCIIIPRYATETERWQRRRQQAIYPALQCGQWEELETCSLLDIVGEVRTKLFEAY